MRLVFGLNPKEQEDVEKEKEVEVEKEVEKEKDVMVEKLVDKEEDMEKKEEKENSILSSSKTNIMSNNPGSENLHGFPSTPLRRNCPPLQGSLLNSSTPHYHHFFLHSVTTQHQHHQDHYLPPHTPRTPSTAIAYGYMGSTNSLSQDSLEEENSCHTHSLQQCLWIDF
jgi:hypothetical protein